MDFQRSSKYPTNTVSLIHTRECDTTNPQGAITRRAWEKLLDPGETEAGGREGTRSRSFCDQCGALCSSHSPAQRLPVNSLGGLAGWGGSSPHTLPHSCPPGPGGVAWPPMAAHTTGLLTWVSRISSLCPPSRAWVRCARTRGCPSLYQVTAGSGSESVSQLRMALSPALTRNPSWGPLGACLKVGGTGAGSKQSGAAPSLARPPPAPPRGPATRKQPMEAHRGHTVDPTPGDGTDPGSQWKRIQAKDLLGDLGKTSCPLWASAS